MLKLIKKASFFLKKSVFLQLKFSIAPSPWKRMETLTMNRIQINKTTLLLCHFLAAVLSMGTVTAQTGTDYSGIFYFVNCGSGKNGDPKIANIPNPDNYFYLVPADNPQQDNKRDAWYSSDYSAANGDSEKPYLTTYKTQKDVAAVPIGVTNRPHNSVWIVKFASTDDGTDYYYLIHAATGKYVVYEPPYSTKNNRKSVHLLTTDSPGENAKFAITINSSHYNFRPKSITSGNIYLNTANNNYNYYYSSDGYLDNPADYFRGLVGLWSAAGDGSDWQKEATLLDAPTISAVDANNKVTIADANSLPSGYVIRYTTDGLTIPTASTGTVYSGAIPITESVTIKAVVVRYGMVLTEVASEVREPVPCASPVITYDYNTSMVSITCATAGSTIYYTIGGSNPSASSTPYNNTPFSVTSPTTVKAIATHTILIPSNVAELVISQVATPTIQNNGSNAISITSTTPSATIYYTTNGSTPTTSSAKYTGPLSENVSNVTIKAIAVKENMITSAVGSGSVKLQCATPIITRDDMTFTLSCSFPTDATLYYSIDGGSEVTYAGTPVSFTSDQLPMTVTTVARHNDYTQSESASMVLRNGTGTAVDPYLIYGTTDFTNFVTNVNNGTTAAAHYKLETDVSASGIGAINTAFTGIFDGGMHTISDLGHALFNTLNGGTVKNLMLDNVSISGGSNVGAICNEATGACRIYNCGVLATGSTVTTDEDGYTQITTCSSTVSGSGYVGGLVGLLDGSSRVINCFSYANVSGGSHVGGIVGYNNVATTATDLQTMVMNCMFYGEVSGSSIAPIYNGKIISNVGNTGVSNFNYFRLESAYIQDNSITKVYNCALGAETRFLQRFEFFRHLLNSNRALAAWWVNSTSPDTSEIMKWVMIPDSIGTTTPYPILKKWGKYSSMVNYKAPTAATIPPAPRKQGGWLGNLSVTIQMDESDDTIFGHPADATITQANLTLPITDKDTTHFNFNYYKVQLPYYNEVGTKNYTDNRVVTGWKITSITGGTSGTFTDSGGDVTYDGSGNISTMPYNFADRNCTNKDLYSVSGRVFNQGAYWDVPEGVTAITIKPYWAKAAYVADAYADVVYNTAMDTKYDVPNVGGGNIYTNGSNYSVNGESQTVYTSISNAVEWLAPNTSHTVNDYAVVLVGNYHQYNEINTSKPYTVTAIDIDKDNEPDYSLILRFDNRTQFHPVKYDFVNLVGLGMAQKSTEGTGTFNFGIPQPLYWFEITNTALLRITQMEYDHDTRTAQPIILHGGVIEQWVSGQNNNNSNRTTYIHVGGNVWFKEFHLGCHQDKTFKTKHPPVSVTGGDFDAFYLTGLYAAADNYEDDAECYINGGRFGTMAGTGMEGIGKTSDHTKGNITWIIDNADINEFYAGGINASKINEGNINTIISNSRVNQYCGGPKFGDMNSGRTVTTTATSCEFGTYFGAGYGGNSYYRAAPRNFSDNKDPWKTGEKQFNLDWNRWIKGEIKANTNSGNYANGVTYSGYNQDYISEFGGVSVGFDYQFLPMSDNKTNVARLFVDFVKFSLATTHNVTSNLKHCIITNNFYGGGSLGKVDGTITSILDSCTVQGNVFGAGFSASLPTVEVDSIGFHVEPYYYTALGTYRTGVKGPTTTFHWVHSDEVNSTETAIQKNVENDSVLYTTEDLTTLGTVTGNVSLTLKGTTTVAGNVFGGGESSAVKGGVDVTVTLEGKTQVTGNVYGGGNQGDVEGNTQVILKD